MPPSWKVTFSLLACCISTVPLPITVVPPLTTPAISIVPPLANSVPELRTVPLKVSVAPFSTLMRPELTMVLPLVASSTSAPLSAFTVAPFATVREPLNCPPSSSSCAPEPRTTPPLLTVMMSPSTRSVAPLPVADTLLDPDTRAPLAICAVPPLLTVMPFAMPPASTSSVPPLKTVVLETVPPNPASSVIPALT